jgi:tetratricopeptide (TPR) repeat protein
MKYSLFLGCTIALVSYANVAAAKTSAEIRTIARASTVEIRLQKNNSIGSGIIIHRQGDTYTLATNRHVLCGGSRCDTLPSGEKYTIKLADGQQQQVKDEDIKILENDLDLAIIQFRSSRNYEVATIAKEILKIDDPVYTAGFPYEKPEFTFNSGRAIAVVNKRLTADKGGYSIIYNAETLPGMSGGGVFNTKGQLVAIHGLGDRYRPGSEEDDNKIDTKIGYNRGIPVRWLVQSISKIGINLGANVATGSVEEPTTADEHFIAGFNKFADPGNNARAGKQQAIKSFSAAIKANPQYASAYFSRAYLYGQLQQFPQALADYNQAISIDSKFTSAYINRGVLKLYQLNDLPGALADYNQAIAINPQYADAFVNRGLLRADKLGKPQEALSDYNQAIKLDPRSATAYYNRALLKDDQLSDTPGALADYNQAINFKPKYAKAYNNRGVLKFQKLKDFTGALTDLDNAISLNPNFVEAYNNRGLLKGNNLNNLQGALVDFNRAIILDPKLALVYYNRAGLKVKMNNANGALADYNQAITVNPQYAPAYLGRGVLKGSNLKDAAGAIQDWRQAEKLFRSQGQTAIADKIAATLQKLGAR